MSDIDQVVLWPSEKNYPRFVEVCEGGVVATYAEFVSRAQPMVDTLRASGANVILVDPDLDDMARWCREQFGNVKSSARAAYAAFVALGIPPDNNSVH